MFESTTSPILNCILSATLALTAAASGGMTAAQTAAAADEGTIRPFRVNVPHAAIDDLRRRIADPVARQGDRRRSIARRAAREASGAGALLGHGLRLAQGGGEAQRLPQFMTRSTASTFISSTSVRGIQTRCR